MPGVLDIDFTKVKRKIRSAPVSAKTSPKNSPTCNRKVWSGFGRAKKNKKSQISTPNLTKIVPTSCLESSSALRLKNIFYVQQSHFGSKICRLKIFDSEKMNFNFE